MQSFKTLKNRFCLAMLSLGLAALTPSGVQAQSLLSDAETEWFLGEITRPIFEVAELDPASVHFYIINDNRLNAFVTGGQNIFIHTGLMLETENVNEVIGVLAHETGHITGSHLARRQEGASTPTSIALISMLLGVAAIAAGAGDAGIGIIGGGQQAAQRTFLSYTRVQEASADQAAAQFLEKAGISGQGLIDTFRRFGTNEYLIGVPQDPYVRSHPLNSDRIERLQYVVEDSPYYDKPPDETAAYYYERIKGKIEGFTLPFDATLRKYPVSDQSTRARYARAYAYHKGVELDKALAEIASLLKDRPDDPYFLELKGQLLFENGRLEESFAPLRQAIKLRPREADFRTLLGRALIATENPAHREEAIKELEFAAQLDGDSPFIWYQLGIAYNLEGNEGYASLAAAEQAALAGQLGPTIANAQRALKLIPSGTPKWQRAQDLLIVAQNFMQDNDITADDLRRENSRRRR